MTPTVLGMLFAASHVAVAVVTFLLTNRAKLQSVASDLAEIQADLKARDIPELLNDVKRALATLDELRAAVPVAKP